MEHSTSGNELGPKELMGILPQGRGSRLDSDTVDGYQVSPASNPSPNTIITLDDDGKLPSSVIPASTNTAVDTQTDVTGSRSSATVYQNTGTIPIFINVSVNISASQDLQIHTDASNPPTTEVAHAGAPGTSSATIPCFAVILPGNYYKATWTGTLTNWTEWT